MATEKETHRRHIGGGKVDEARAEKEGCRKISQANCIVG